MATTKTDIAAAKKAKQTKVLIALGVVLAAVLAIQLPRLMGGSESTPQAAPTTSESGAASTTAAPSTTGTTVEAAASPAVTLGTGPRAELAGVTVAATGSPSAGVTQLASFSLFESRDPFVQSITDADRDPSPAPPASSGTGGEKAEGAGKSGATAAPQSGGANTPDPDPTHATISVNGEPQSLQVKDTFPADDPLFVLVSLKDKSAKIGVAGGSLKNAKAATLTFDRKLTLVNTATGARYRLALLYTGDSPEQVQGFTPEAEGEAAK